MSVIRVQNLVPDVYEEESRDFQLLGRIFDLALNSTKYDIDSMIDILDTDKCRSRMLQLLKYKIGFISNDSFSDDALRYILRAFPSLIREKGTDKCIIDAIMVYTKSVGDADGKLKIRTQYDSKNSVMYVYIVSNNDINIINLQKLVMYFAPTGMKIKYSFLTETDENIATSTTYSDEGSKDRDIGNGVSSMVGGVEQEGVDTYGSAIVGLAPIAENKLETDVNEYEWGTTNE